MNPINPMNTGAPINPNPSGPVNPINPGNGSVYDDDGLDMTRIYQIIIGVLGLIILVLIIFVFVYRGKANKTQSYINSVSTQAANDQSKKDKVSCDTQIKDIRENPWTAYTALDEFGGFTFNIPRNWSQYEQYDDNANDPYLLYFNPGTVHYDSKLRVTHAALEVDISKKLYADEIKEMEDKLKQTKDPFSEDAVKISNFTGTKFVYTDKDLGETVGVIVLPYRDRALFIKTDDYNQWNKDYYTPFYQSFALTP